MVKIIVLLGILVCQVVPDEILKLLEGGVIFTQTIEFVLSVLVIVKVNDFVAAWGSVVGLTETVHAEMAAYMPCGIIPASKTMTNKIHALNLGISYIIHQFS